MIITKEVEVTITAGKAKYYRQLGYDCKVGDIISVPIEKVHSGCKEKIWYRCDICNKPKQVMLKSFRTRHDLNKDAYCVDCTNLLKRVGSIEKARLYANTKAKDGYRICKKCLRELPLDIIHFNPDIMCDNGLRFVCRECSGDSFKIHDENWCKPWSDSEIELLKEVYAKFSNSELVEKYFPDRTNRGIESMASKIGCSGKEGVVRNKTHEDFMIDFERVKRNNKNLELVSIVGKYVNTKTNIKAWCDYCKKEWDAIPSNLLKGCGCPRCKGRFVSEYRKTNGIWKGENNPRHIHPMNGSENPNWKDGITPLYQELRSDTREWFIETGMLSNFKCVITGLRMDNVHHLVPFKDIISEVFEVLNLERKRCIADYTNVEEESIRSLLKELHIQYGLGAGVNKLVHKLFHDNYGYFNTTKEDFRSFVIGIRNGVYDDYFIENNLPINLNEKALDIILN